MPEFQKKNNKFLHQGMNWNAPVDLMPEGQIPYARNVRVTQAGTVTQRPGLTLYADLQGAGSYIHTISRLNNSDTNVNFSRALVVGKDSSVYVGGVITEYGTEAAANAAIVQSLLDGARNPVPMPSGITLSGNPISIVDMAPVGSNAGWKYCGDTGGNFAIGYYPGDSPVDTANPNNHGKARVITMGMKPPVIGTGNCNLQVETPGNLDGKYQWMFAFRNRWTGARSNPSAPTRDSQAIPGTTVTAGYATMTLPYTSDAQSIVIDVYRFGGNVDDWRYVGTGDGGSFFTDNLADTEILTGTPPPEIIDSPGSQPRPNLYQPFITQDYARYGWGTLGVSAGGVWYLNWTNGAPFSHHFNPGWLQGSFISVNNGSFSIYEASSDTQVILSEDLSGMTVGGVPVANGTLVKWSTHAGTLTMGAAMAHIWGPYGLGQSGAYIFGCGDPANAGTLFWTNGNDPDSTDLPNSVIVTSPSEPLRGGCIYDGTPFVFSTERMFRIYPGAVAGQFTVQEVPSSKGILEEYSLTVQTNNIADQSITWVGKDGIYDWSASGGLRTMTDRDLYPFFPHDNQPGVDVANLLPWLAEPTPIQAPNFTPFKTRFHRLCWFQGELFYDFPAGTTDYNTLVHDTKQVNGWASVDQYPAGGGGYAQEPVGRGIEIAGNNMFVAVGAKLFTYTGANDNGITIPCRFTTRSDDLGDPRVVKLYGDYFLDTNTNSVPLTVSTWVNHYKGGKATTATVSTMGRGQTILDFNTGLGLLAGAHSLDLTWNATNTVTLYQWGYTFVPKPEVTQLRATDRTDDGYNGAKYLRGLCIECMTGGANRTVNVLVDGANVGTLTVSATSQLEVPFAITPVVGSEFQILPTDATNWELFAIRWVWEKWPDLTVIESPWMDLGTVKPKYLRGFSMPISGPALPVNFLATYDKFNASVNYPLAPVTPESLVHKSPGQFSFNPPILVHQIKLKPSAPCRCWYDQIVWDAEEWPELATLHGPVEKLGDSGAKYLRGLELPIETNGQPIIMKLNYDKQAGSSGSTATETFEALTTDILSKNVFPLTPAVPIIAHEFQLVSTAPGRFWYQEVKWDYEPWAELSDGRGAITDGGDPRAKFMQGLVIPMDSNGASVMFDVIYDNGVTEPVGPLSTVAGYKTGVPWSYPVPFITHEMQLVPRTACRVFFEEVKWVWEPIPELVTTYTTQETDLDLPGYHYQFDAYIAYIGTSTAPVLHVKTEYSTVDYALPVSNGVFTRAHVMLQPQKAKWRSFSLTSPTGIRIFLKDCEVRAKPWTDKGNYPSAFQSHHPFGDESRAVGARI